MTATPPEAKLEYSRAPGGSKRASRPAAPASPAGSLAVLGAGLIGAVALVVAELTTLYEVHSGARQAVVKTIGTGSNHGYAMALIGVCAAALAIGAARTGSRPALLGLVVLGLVALLIALLGDLPDAQSNGLLPVGGGYATANSTASTGLYLETLGAILLLIAGGLGFFLFGPAPRARRSGS